MSTSSFKKDVKRKELVPIKILMFLIYGGQATLYPYFTVHLKSLNVSIRQTAILFAVQPIVALVVAPMVGMAADKVGNFRLIFSFFLIFSAVITNLLLLVPPVPQIERLFYLECDSHATSSLNLFTTESCELDIDLNNTYINTSGIFQCHQENETPDAISTVLLGKDDASCQEHYDGIFNEDCIAINQTSSFDIYLKVTFPYDDNTSSVKTISHYLIVYKNEIYNYLKCSCLSSECNTKCSFFNQRLKIGCLGVVSENENFGVTFWSYLSIRLVVTLGIGLVNGLFDSASMAVIQNLKADVGYQRFWATVGMCLLAPVSGYFVDEYGSFKPCFFMYGGLYLTAAIISLKLDLSMKLPSENPMKNFVQLIRNPEVIFLLFQITLLGICWGFLENFLFWFLESELGSNNLIMGLTVTVGSGTGLFMALVATWCTKKLGYVNVILLAFAAYTIRFLGYAFAQNAYVCLIFEMMENFTVTLLTVGVTLYCTELASMEMLTTVMTLWNGLHVISGRAFGSLLGGFLVQQFGFRQTFKLFAYGSASFGAFYALMYITWLRRWQIDHRKISVNTDGTSSFISEEKEDEALKNQAFSSLSMHCSCDSPAIVSYGPEPDEIEHRRRALSHVPMQTRNSFCARATIPRHAVSFNEGTLKRSYFIGQERIEEMYSSNRQHKRISHKVEEIETECVTKF